MRRIHQSIRSEAGFTFIEAIIYLAIVGAVVAAFVQFILGISATRSKAVVLQEVQSNARIVRDMFGQQVRAATGVRTASSTFAAHPGRLVLTMSSSTLNPTILSVVDGHLYLKQGIYPTSSITTDMVTVTNFVLSDYTGNSSRANIGLDMTLEYTNPSNDVSYETSLSIETSASSRQ